MRAFSINRAAVLLWLGAVSAVVMDIVFGPHPSEKQPSLQFTLWMLFLCVILCVASVSKMYDVRRRFDIIVIFFVGLVLCVMTVSLTLVIGHYIFGWGR